MTTTTIENLTTATSIPCIDLSQMPSNIKAKVKFSTKAKTDTAANIRDKANSYIDELKESQLLYANFLSLEDKANRALYKFLSNVHSIIAHHSSFQNTLTKKETNSYKESVATLIERELKAKGVEYTKATSTEAKALRFICGNLSASREKTWTKVLKEATKAQKEIGVNKFDFELWITSEGGVYEVANSTNGKTKSANNEELISKSAKMFKNLTGEKLNGIDVMPVISGGATQSLDDYAQKCDDELKDFSITLNFKKTPSIHVQDQVAVKRLLLLVAKAFKDQKVPTNIDEFKEVFGKEVK